MKALFLCEICNSGIIMGKLKIKKGGGCRINIIFRILLAVYAFCLTVISLITLVLTLRPEMIERASKLLVNDVLPNRGLTLLMLFIEVAFLGLSLMFLLSGVRSEKDKKSVSKYNNVGEIRISLNAIESIALNASKKVSGIRENKAYVTKQGDHVSVFIKTIVMPDVNIPALLEDIQVKVKKSVEESTGIAVNEVRASVENIYTGYKSRVE